MIIKEEMNEYLVLHWKQRGKEYIEARFTNKSDGPAKRMISQLYETDFLFISSPSKNQARKAGYITWIDSTAKGYNKFSRV